MHRALGEYPMKILYLHGWNSVVGGVKPTYLRSHGHEVIEPALDHDDFERALATAQAAFDEHRPNVVVGSSRGGAVAMNLRNDSARLVLLCPAWKKWGSAKTVRPGTMILHSRGDDVIPFEESLELVRASGLPDGALVEVGTDHRLADLEPLEALARAVEAG
jgi:alpha-beta hydrolase superfamily lysophospholipase